MIAVSEAGAGNSIFEWKPTVILVVTHAAGLTGTRTRRLSEGVHLVTEVARSFR